MYISYRKAYISGMNPLTFLTFFTFGELTMMTIVAVTITGGIGPFWRELVGNRAILLWPMLGGFMWVVGDLFQNYAAKYVGISRGIPLSNTNQLWGLLLGLTRVPRVARVDCKRLRRSDRRVSHDGAGRTRDFTLLGIGGRICQLAAGSQAGNGTVRN